MTSQEEVVSRDDLPGKPVSSGVEMREGVANRYWRNLHTCTFKCADRQTLVAANMRSQAGTNTHVQTHTTRDRCEHGIPSREIREHTA